MQLNPYNQYKQTSVQTASPEQLVIMLYDGAIKFLKMAREAIEYKNIADANKYIVKTQDIINEFIVSLDMSAGEIALNLNSIYNYWNQRLVEANVKKDDGPVEEVLHQLEELRGTWVAAVTKFRESKPKLSGGVNVEG